MQGNRGYRDNCNKKSGAWEGRGTVLDIENYWRAVLKQDAHAMKGYFRPDACVRWHNTNEQFTVDEFIRANCEYPGKWDGKVERVETKGDTIITVAHVYALDDPLSFHVVSFIGVEDDRITVMDEYWGDDGEAPRWRQEKHIGKAIDGN